MGSLRAICFYHSGHAIIGTEGTRSADHANCTAHAQSRGGVHPPNRTRKQRKSPADAALGLTSFSLRIYKLPKPAMFKDSHTTPTKTAPGQRRTDFAPCLLPYLVLSANLQAPRAYINLGLTPKASPQGQGRTDYAPSIASRGALINVNCFLRDLLFAL